MSRFLVFEKESFEDAKFLREPFRIFFGEKFCGVLGLERM